MSIGGNYVPGAGAAGRQAPSLRAGALNLLSNCVGLGPGQSVLLVAERAGLGYYDDRVAAVVADEARRAGARVQVIVAPETDGPEDFPAPVAAAMREADHTIFFSRLGDQVRFVQLPGPGSKTMSYTLDLDYLGSDFACVPFGLYRETHDRLVAEIGRTRRCTIRCPLGTELEMTAPAPGADEPGGPDMTDFTVTLFPVMIFPPVSCAAMSGKLVLGHWLVSTSTHRYDSSALRLDEPVTARIESGRIVGFDGPAAVAARIERQFERVGEWAGGDPFTVDSWHTGINPKTFYARDPAADVERWGGVAYGSPRYTHFHMCGSDPGDICATLIDATISFDGEPIWEEGRFRFLERPEIRALPAKYAADAGAFEMRWDIGV